MIGLTNDGVLIGAIGDIVWTNFSIQLTDDKLIEFYEAIKVYFIEKQAKIDKVNEIAGGG